MEFLQTPGAHTSGSSLAVFQHTLTENVFELGLARRSEGDRLAQKAAASVAVFKAEAVGPIQLRPASTATPHVLIIASSTGGPKALLSLFENLSPSVTLPILIAQHIPPVFTGALAQNITRVSGRACAEGEDGELVRAGRVYVAPGDYHMVLEPDGNTVCIRLNQESPINYCRRSADPLLVSAANIYGANVLGLVLTGMGKDGKGSCETITKAGGTIIAQDQDTSVIWGMPGAVAQAGLCSAVLPLDEIPGFLQKAVAE